MRPWLAPAPADTPLSQRVFAWEMYRNKRRFREAERNVACNHLENNGILVTKHGLYHLMKAYCAVEGREPMARFMPLTFHLRGTDASDEE